MKPLFFAALVGFAGSAAVAGCTLDTGSDTETTTSEGDRNTGTVRLDLQGTAPNGTIYRLRQATFTVNTTPPTTLSSESSPANATFLSASLPPGSYFVTLQPGWVLDRVNAQGVGQPVVASLVSANPAMAGVQVGATFNVNFQFQTSGVLITTGTLNIGIGVTEVNGGTGQACTPFSNPPSCNAPLWCGPGTPQPTCQAGGTVPLNGMCATAGANICAANLLCVVSGATMTGLCKQACNPAVANACGMGACTPFQGSMQFGTCP